MGAGGAAGRQMQRAEGFGDIVGIDSRAGDMLARAVMGQRFAHAALDRRLCALLLLSHGWPSRRRR